jgi:hypothetical protein
LGGYRCEGRVIRENDADKPMTNEVRRMSEQKQERGSSSGINLRIRNMFLVILVALCTFGGPFLVYVFTRLLQVDVLVSMAFGFALFFFGLGLIVFMAWKKIIT